MRLNLERNDNSQNFNLKIYFTRENDKEYYSIDGLTKAKVINDNNFFNIRYVLNIEIEKIWKYELN